MHNRQPVLIGQQLLQPRPVRHLVERPQDVLAGLRHSMQCQQDPAGRPSPCLKIPHHRIADRPGRHHHPVALLPGSCGCIPQEP
jgi:hypothetical protein